MSFLTDAEIVISALHQYYQESITGEKPVITQVPIEKLITDLGVASHICDGGLSGERLSQFITTYLSSTTRLHHPAYLAHQVAVPHYAGAIAALIDG
ncbi:MAG: diaminobutyrate decarboxylase, partial [bacterium]|nr:diaminobutyrate decarboxylase [bacterium]